VKPFIRRMKMSRGRIGRAWFTVLTVALVFMAACTSWAEVPRMTTEDLKGKLGNAEIVVVDVRTDGDWKSSDVKIQGAERVDPRDLEPWMDKLDKDKTLVFYCA
jgi:hypothetical protein